MQVIFEGQPIELDVNKDTFVPEDIPTLTKVACQLPGLLARYGVILADLKSQTEKAKFTLDEISSFVSDEARTKEGKLTSDKSKEIISLDSRVQKSRMDYVSILRDMHAIDNVLKALYKKGDIVTTLLYQHRQEMKMYHGTL